MVLTASSSISPMGIIADKSYVYCEVRTESLTVLYFTFALRPCAITGEHCVNMAGSCVHIRSVWWGMHVRQWQSVHVWHAHGSEVTSHRSEACWLLNGLTETAGVAVTLQTHIQEGLGSYLGRHTTYAASYISWFSSASLKTYRASTAIRPRPVLSRSVRKLRPACSLFLTSQKFPEESGRGRLWDTISAFPRTDQGKHGNVWPNCEWMLHSASRRSVLHTVLIQGKRLRYPLYAFFFFVTKVGLFTVNIASNTR
jgi:hypothetical protein